jgi:hypothetical protein
MRIPKAQGSRMCVAHQIFPDSFSQHGGQQDRLKGIGDGQCNGNKVEYGFREKVGNSSKMFDQLLNIA